MRSTDYNKVKQSVFLPTDTNSERMISMTKVKYPLLTILIGLLILATLTTLYVPTIEVGEKTISVMGYISFPTNHTDVGKMFKSLYADFNINREVWWMLLTQILGIGSLALFAVYPNEKKSMAMPVFFSLVGIVTVAVNRIVAVSGTTYILIALMAVILLLTLYNADLLRKDTLKFLSKSSKKA